MKKLCVAGVAVLLGCGGNSGVGPDESRVAGWVEPLSVVQFSGIAGGLLADSVAVLVRGPDGAPLPGFPVTWVVTAGDGSLAGTRRTDPQGVARAAWTLGTAAGEHQAEARVSGATPIAFSASVAPGAAAAIATDHEQLTFDLPVDSVLLAATLTDRYGNALPAATVEWHSSDDQVASVDASGLVRAVGGGAATVTARAGAYERAVPVTVDLPRFTVPFVDLDRAVFFSAFGEPLSPQHDNVAYEIYLDDDSMEVASVSSGQVERVVYQEDTGDYEIFIRYSDSWMVLYDHLTAPAVEVGETVAPGDLLGLVPYFGLRQVGMDLVPMGRTELQVNYTGEHAPSWAWCPALFGSPEFNAAHQAAVLRASAQTSTCVKQTARP